MPAAPALARIVATYWGFAVNALPHPDFVHRVWPDGCVTLAFCCTPGRPTIAVIAGPSVSATEVHMNAGQHFWGVRFRPEAGGVCCNRSAPSLRDDRMNASEVFGERLASVVLALEEMADAEDVTRAGEIIDRWLQDTLPDELPLDTLVSAAVDLIVADDGTLPIRTVAQRLGVTVRHLQRRFRQATGLSPKEFASVRRGRAAMKRMLVPQPRVAGLAQLAAESGYADQSHLSREFSRLTTFTPTVLAARLDEIAHDRLID
ncbi:MAG: helix-turn-helix transcriptional regulator [Gemmatimonadaceae bacterium]|nr:helix-turn-helix transcriptional regulator [Gemmatimonadaceae bacterium]